MEKATTKSRNLGTGRGASLARAELAFRSYRTEEAIVILLDLLDQEPEHIGALELLAKAYWQAGEHRDVLATLARLIRLNPYESGYHALRGAALQCLGRYGEAVRAYRRAENDPSAAQMIEELFDWQSRLIRQMIAESPTFRAAYLQDPEMACAQYGFELNDRVSSPRWINVQSGDTRFARPS